LSARFVTDEFDFGPHDRLDDLESFFHTLQWIVLRFVNHGMDREKLGSTLYATFDRTLPGPKGSIYCDGRLHSIRGSIWNECENFKGVLPDLLETFRETINSRYYLKEKENGPPTANTTILAELAILFNDFRDPTWFRDRLRDAATNPLCPTNDASKRQDYEPVQDIGLKKATKSEYNPKVSAIEYYYESQDHASKKLRLDAEAAYPKESRDETDDTKNVSKDLDFEHRRRKTPYGKKI
jgi:hypothetical protein